MYRTWQKMPLTLRFFYNLRVLIIYIINYIIKRAPLPIRAQDKKLLRQATVTAASYRRSSFVRLNCLFARFRRKDQDPVGKGAFGLHVIKELSFFEEFGFPG